MIITISGLPGSGKSYIAKRLADQLSWQSFDVGAHRRQMAKTRNMTLAEYNKLGETDPTTDREADDWQIDLGQTKDNFVISGRLAWHFIPDSLKIFLRVDPQTGAQRVFGSLQKSNVRNEDNNLDNIEAVAASNAQRIASDKLRYQQYYNLDAYDESHYDFILDTTNLNQEQVFNEMMEFLKQNKIVV